MVTGWLRRRLRSAIALEIGTTPRFGHPTYVAPSSTDVLIIDTQTTKTQNFSQKQQVKKSPLVADSNHLALLVMKGDTFEPTIWDQPQKPFHCQFNRNHLFR